MCFVFVSKNNLKLCEFMASHQRFCNRVVCDAVVISTISRRIQRWLQWVLKYITLIRENSNLRDNTNWHNRKYTDVARTERAIVIYGECQINVAHNRNRKSMHTNFIFSCMAFLHSSSLTVLRRTTRIPAKILVCSSINFKSNVMRYTRTLFNTSNIGVYTNWTRH